MAAEPHAARPTRGGRWQVSLAECCQWHTCLSEHDARYIASGLNLVAAVRRGERRGEEAARQLDEVAEAVVRNLGEGWTARMVRVAAAMARGPAPKTVPAESTQ